WPVWESWRMDETYIKGKGVWRYLYRAGDKYGETIDFLLTKHRDKEAALRFLKKAIRRNGVPGVSVLGGTRCSLNDWPRRPDDAAWAWATHQSVTTRSRTDQETTA